MAPTHPGACVLILPLVEIHQAFKGAVATFSYWHGDSSANGPVQQLRQQLSLGWFASSYV